MKLIIQKILCCTGLLFPAGLALSSPINPSIPNSAPDGDEKDVQSLTQTIIVESKRFQTLTKTEQAKSLAAILNWVQIRKSKFLKFMQTDPENVAQLAMSKEDVARLPPEVQALIELHVSEQGTLEVLIIDYKDKSETQYFLRSIDGIKYKLYLPKALFSFQSGTQIKIDAIKLDDILAYSGSSTLQRSK